MSERVPNRLIAEKSPYLLQHAFNPVAWYPWGEDAFDRARRENRPIFLSIGYSTCHWCHVMERESFENLEIASLMNDLYVNIKVDREERPDVDRVYMTTVQALTGHGGWPLSVWLTPELEPFFGGTYFPPESSYGRPGFRELLMSLRQTWNERQGQVEGSARKILDTLARREAVSEAPDDRSFASIRNLLRLSLARGHAQLARSYDPARGGFSNAPKFPRPVNFNFLLRYWYRTGEQSALDMTLESLRQMWAGGLYDHLGGGFHRYSVDGEWRIPHFEKMLYDQAQLVVSYLEAYQITGEPFFAEVVREVIDYCLRDMLDVNGGFHSAEDADSPAAADRPEHKEEGAFYMWTAAEVEAIVGEEAPVVQALLGVREGGNAISDPTGELGERNVLYRATTPAEAAKRFSLSEAAVVDILERAREALYQARGLRPRPHRDDKIITSWNGLMISALSRAGAALGEGRYLQAARSAASCIESNLYAPESGTLLRRYREGEARHPAHLEDYAFLVQGCLDLYEAVFDGHWLELAQQLTETQNRLFWDHSAGGFFDTAGMDSSIVLRTREFHDGAEPSGSSVAICNLIRQAWMLDRTDWLEMAERAITSVSRVLEVSPVAMPQTLVAVEMALEPPRQIVIAGEPGGEDSESLLAEVQRRFLPRKVQLVVDGESGLPAAGEAAGFYRTLQRLDGKATAYVCEEFACQLPTTEPSVLAEILDQPRQATGDSESK